MKNIIILLLTATIIGMTGSTMIKADADTNIKRVTITDKVIAEYDIYRPRWTNRGVMSFVVDGNDRKAGDYFVQGSWELESKVKITDANGNVTLDSPTSYEEGIIVNVPLGATVELENSNIELIEK